MVWVQVLSGACHCSCSPQLEAQLRDPICCASAVACQVRVLLAGGDTVQRWAGVMHGLGDRAAKRHRRAQDCHSRQGHLQCSCAEALLSAGLLDALSVHRILSPACP